MFKFIPARKRHFSDFSWLKTFWLFSFSNYYDPRNTQFGNLLVYNDDVIVSGEGFGKHPHDNMEIVTLVFEGALTHEDDMGNRAAIHPNEVQCMSAGTGVLHSEFNEGAEPVHLHQIWFLPKTRGISPSYSQKIYDPALWRNQFQAVASGLGAPGALPIHAEANLYRCCLEAGASLNFEPTQRKHVFIYSISGRMCVNEDFVLSKGDQLRMEDSPDLRFVATETADFILIES